MSGHKQNDQFTDPISGQLEKANRGQELTDEEIEEAAGGAGEYASGYRCKECLKRFPAWDAKREVITTGGMTHERIACPACGSFNVEICRGGFRVY